MHEIQSQSDLLVTGITEFKWNGKSYSATGLESTATLQYDNIPQKYCM